MILLMLFLIINNGKNEFAEGTFNFIRDFIQYNVAGIPVIHQETQWNFDPEIGKKRRARYETENGYHGEKAIAKLGMGIGYLQPWNTLMMAKIILLMIVTVFLGLIVESKATIAQPKAPNFQYFERPKYRYPYYDENGKGKLLYGYGGSDLYEYRTYTILEGIH
ncbi:hypothetical protein V1478_013993 [Vespula squamosa]|uniref:Uncharacterized protein n=1 Tax=Vespula squamosa TaxID=30214 RepID=A0ABD2A7I7_VESSQ